MFLSFTGTSYLLNPVIIFLSALISWPVNNVPNTIKHFELLAIKYHASVIPCCHKQHNTPSLFWCKRTNEEKYDLHEMHCNPQKIKSQSVKSLYTGRYLIIMLPPPPPPAARVCFTKLKLIDTPSFHDCYESG